ncbi:MAG: hypothetical protein HGB11_08705 [Chlorobiales bacterium]|nr:hypothetical protein [Chlorobiales bacterium]
MALAEILYSIAFSLFLIGAAKSFRENGSQRSVTIMSVAVLIDFLTAMLPLAGVEFLKMHIQGSNLAIAIGVILGFVVWMLFLLALLIKHKGKLQLYHSMITLIEILWFIDFISFLYGTYKFSLT